MTLPDDALLREHVAGLRDCGDDDCDAVADALDRLLAKSSADPSIRTRVKELLIDDPECQGKVCSATIDALAGLLSEGQDDVCERMLFLKRQLRQERERAENLQNENTGLLNELSEGPQPPSTQGDE